MYQYRFENVRLLLAEPNTEIRQGLLAALRDYGFRNVATAVTRHKLDEALAGSEIDLIIGDSHYDRDTISNAVKNMRHSKLNDNPFPVSIALCSEPLEKNIKTAVDAGFDDVIAKPAPVNKIVARIAKQIANRKKFVIAHTYIGPDRRKAPRPEDEAKGVEVPLVDVPNPLKAIAEEGLGYKELKQQILAAQFDVKDRWVRRSAEQFDTFARQLSSYHLYGESPEKIPLLVGYLKDMAHELHGRLEGAHKAAASELCLSAMDVVDRMAEKPDALQGKDIELLPNLSKAIVKAFEKKASQQYETVFDISETVRKTG